MCHRNIQMKYAITLNICMKKGILYIHFAFFCRPRQHPARWKIKFQDLLEFTFSIVVSFFWMKRYHLARRLKQRWVIEKKQNNQNKIII